ncbi:hypothetical protein Cni_G13681 [Canna indica]|uniref:CCHC-type domain-containing protein n=1 Tax=Canna indica TaxID=4628 RepID=A0AAQ3KD26_9LILI|nr:hypothetical protein Cni_G13681 [Canna indica]
MGSQGEPVLIGECSEQPWTLVSRRKRPATPKHVSFTSAPKPSSSSWIGASRSFASTVKLGCPSPTSSSVAPPPSALISARRPSIDEVVSSLRARGCCFNCTQPGHLSRRCVNRQVCFLCRRVGHSSRACPAYRRASLRATVAMNSARSAVHQPVTALNSSFKAGDSPIYAAMPGSSSSSPSPIAQPISTVPPIPVRSSMANRPENVRAMVPNSRSTAERASYLSRRCILVIVRGQLHQQADLAGFLARQFNDYHHHLQ